jgi:hypothetical protein
VGEDLEIDESVTKHGWHAISVDDHDPLFLYTCGLLSRHSHPELIMLGLDSEAAHVVVADIIEHIQAGTRLEPGSRLELSKHLTVQIGVVHRSQHQRFLGYAMGHARLHGLKLRALQVFWPDNNGFFPTDLACDGEVCACQPRLALPATPSERRAFRDPSGDS